MNDNSIVDIEGRQVHLMAPVDLKCDWIGGEYIKQQLAAAWLVMSEHDRPMNPIVVGRPGCGKTTLAAAMAKLMQQELYIFQCTMDTRPEDLVIMPVLTEQKTVRYQASSLVSAMIRGGICILDEGNRMRDKAWASLAPLLDARRYLESVVIGCRIDAHKDFRIVSTMNEDASVYNLPEYINSRLRPRIEIPDPDSATTEKIIRANLPFVNEDVLKTVLLFLDLAHQDQKTLSLRQAVQLADLSNRRVSVEFKNLAAQKPDLNKIVEESAVAVADISKIRLPHA